MTAAHASSPSSRAELDWAIRDMPICDHCGEPCVAVLPKDMWLWRHLAGSCGCRGRRTFASVEGTGSVEATIRHTTTDD